MPCSTPTLDSDGDGIADVNDNCLNVPNANQRDTSGTGIGNACNTDLNHDGIVNTLDLALFKAAYAAYNSSAHTYTPNADFNGDGVIDTKDLAILEQYLGKPPGPSALVPSLQATPLSVNFGNSFVGVAASLPITVKNNGCKPVQILSATISGGAGFSVFPPYDVTLSNPGQSATINVGFTPQATGPVTATLTLTTNGGAVICITLFGTGVNPAPGQVPILVAPSTLSFGNVSPGGTATQTLTIGNIGTAPLIVTGIPPGNSLYSVDPSLLGGFPLILAPQQTVSMPVKLTAAGTVGPANGTLTIINNDPLRANWNVNLQGNVVAAPVAIVNNPVTSAQVFNGSTPITAQNCASVTRAVTFGSGTNSADSFEVVITDATGKSVTSAAFPAPSSPGAQVLTGINVCGLADSTLSTSVLYIPASGSPPPPFVGTPATKDTSPSLSPPTLTPPSAPYFTSSAANICGTSRASTTVTITGGTSPVSTVLDAATTTFCLSVPLMPNQQSTLVATAVDDLAPPPRPSESSLPLEVTQVNPSQIVIASATSTPLNATQVATLVANGVINLQNPSNFNISIFTIVLTIGSFPVTVTQPVVVPITSSGGGTLEVGGGSGGGGWVSTGNGAPVVATTVAPSCTETCSTIIAIQPPQGPVIPGVLIIDGTIKTLKEFFQVTLAVQNTSSSFTLSGVGSSLSLPAGSLTAVSAGVGTNIGTLAANGASTLSIGTILPGATGTGQYIIRGDAIGSYALNVQYNGFITGGGLVNGGVAFNGSAGTSVQVQGPPSLGVVVHFPQPPDSSYDVVANQNFTLTVDITDNSSQPALYPSLDLVVGGNLTLIDPTTLLPIPQALQSLPNINPGQTVTTSFLMRSSAQGYVIACQGLSSTNVSLGVDIGSQNAPCNLVNSIPAAFSPPSPSAPPTVLGISPANGQGNQPITTSVIAELTPVAACLTGDTFTNVVTAPINPSNPAAGIQVTGADLQTPGTFYVEELDASGNAVRHVPVQLQSVDDSVNGTTIATLRLGLAVPLSQYFLKSQTNYRATLVGADLNSPAGAVCNSTNQTPLAKTYQWTFQSALSCVNDVAPVGSLGEPAAGSTGQPVGTPIVVNFTNAINGQSFVVDPSSPIADSFSVWAGATVANGDVSGGTLVQGSVSLTNQGKNLTFTPAGNLPYSTVVTVRLNNTLTDLCGTALSTSANGIQLFSFTTASIPVAPPAPPVVNPLATALTSLPAVQVSGTAPSGTAVTVAGGASSVSAATAAGGLFSLSVPLLVNQQNAFSVTAIDSAGHVSAAVTTDINGKALTVQSDQVAPTVTGSSPANGATAVPVGSPISVAFSKAINTGTANSLNVNLTTGGTSVAGTVAASGSGLTFTPSTPLTTGTQYQLTLRAGGITDLAGNTLASTYVVAFTTVAGTATLSTVTPAAGTAGSTFPVTFTGTNLAAVSAVVSANTGITGTVSAASATSVTASVVIAATAATGATTLGIVVGGATLSLPFTVNGAAPTIAALAPAVGQAGQTLPVVISGTNLLGITGITVSGTGVSASIVAGGTSTAQAATLVIARTALTGARTVLITTASGTATATFTVNPASPLSVSLTPSPLALATESATTLTLTLSNAAPSGGQLVNLATGAGLVAISPSSVTVAAGSTGVTVTVTSSATAGSDTITASGTGLTSGTDGVQIQARGFSLNASLVGLGRTATGIITLAQPAPASGAAIALSVANTSVATVSPSSVVIAAGQTTATFTLTGGATAGTTTLTADGTASGFARETAGLTVSNADLNLSSAQTLAFGQAGNYQVQISAAAPSGGVAVSLTSSNAAVATVPASVTIAAGALSANFTVQAGTSATGTSTLTATSASFASTTTTVNVTAGLSISETAKTLASTQSDAADFQLMSGGTAYAAPAGGTIVTASSSNPACVNLRASTVTVAAGQTFGSAPFAYATAALPCTATVTLTTALFGTASISVTYLASAGAIILPGGIEVGGGLQYEVVGLLPLLGAVADGGLTVNISSSDPTKLLVSPDSSTAGTPFINVSVPNGTSVFPFYVQGVAGTTGAATLTASTTDTAFQSGAATVTVVEPQLLIYGLPAGEPATGADAPFGVAVYVPGYGYSFEAVAAGSALAVTLSSSNTSAADLSTSSSTRTSPVTVTIAAGAFLSPAGVASGGVALHAVGTGITTVTATAPGTLSASQAVTLD